MVNENIILVLLDISEIGQWFPNMVVQCGIAEPGYQHGNISPQRQLKSICVILINSSEKNTCLCLFILVFGDDVWKPLIYNSSQRSGRV